MVALNPRLRDCDAYPAPHEIEVEMDRPIIVNVMNFARAPRGEPTLLSFDDGTISPTTLEETSHYQITKGLLEHPERYWQHLLREEEEG